MLTTREMYRLPAVDYDNIENPAAVRRSDIASLVLAVLPLLVDVRLATSFNGRVAMYADIADMLLGIALLVAALSGRPLVRASTGRTKAIRFAITVGLSVLAVFYMATGGGLLMR